MKVPQRKGKIANEMSIFVKFIHFNQFTLNHVARHYSYMSLFKFECFCQAKYLLDHLKKEELEYQKLRLFRRSQPVLLSETRLCSFAQWPVNTSVY